MKNNHTRFNARSKTDGIIFYSNTFPFWGMETSIDDSGNIHSRFIPSYCERFSDYVDRTNTENTKVKKWKIIVFNILIILSSILAFIFSKNISFILSAVFFSAFVTSDFFNLMKITFENKSKNNKNYSKAKFHAAEHMVVNAYEKLERLPTLEEVKNFSRFHKHCGSNHKIFKVLIFSLYSIVIIFCSINPIAYCILVVLVILFGFVAEKYGLLNFLQVLVTNKPSDKELELVIEGLLQFEMMEENLQSDLFAQNVSMDFLP